MSKSFWKHLLVILLIDVESQSVHPQPQLCSFLILDVEVIDSVHLQVLSDLQVLHHGLLSVDKRGWSLISTGLVSMHIGSVHTEVPHQALVLFMPNLDPLLPLLLAEFVLIEDSENTSDSVRNLSGWRVVELVARTVLPLWEQIFVVQVAWCVDFFVIVGVLGLHCIGGQEYCRLWRAVDVII